MARFNYTSTAVSDRIELEPRSLTDVSFRNLAASAIAELDIEIYVNEPTPFFITGRLWLMNFTDDDDSRAFAQLEFSSRDRGFISGFAEELLATGETQVNFHGSNAITGRLMPDDIYRLNASTTNGSHRNDYWNRSSTMVDFVFAVPEPVCPLALWLTGLVLIRDGRLKRLSRADWVGP